MTHIVDQKLLYELLALEIAEYGHANPPESYKYVRKVKNDFIIVYEDGNEGGYSMQVFFADGGYEGAPFYNRENLEEIIPLAEAHTI
jgi:hypothetical protein